MNLADLLPVVGVIAPGFVALKFVYVFGGQHRRLEWEWAIWSAVLGLLLTALTPLMLGLFTSLRGTLPAESVEIVTRYVLAVLFGATVAFVWERFKGSDREWCRKVVRFLSDSAWDFVLDQADRKGRGVEVVTEDGNKGEVNYYGTIDTFGQEVAEAEPWVYLTYVSRWEGGGYKQMKDGTVGVFLHRAHIKRMRFIDAQQLAEETRAAEEVKKAEEAKQAGMATGTAEAAS